MGFVDLESWFVAVIAKRLVQYAFDKERPLFAYYLRLRDARNSFNKRKLCDSWVL